MTHLRRPVLSGVEGSANSTAGEIMKPRRFSRSCVTISTPLRHSGYAEASEFERVYPERYQKVYGYWRPVVRSSIVTSFCFARYMGFQPNFIKFLRGDKFLKPAVSLSNRAAISKRALPEYVALTVKLNFLLHSHAGNEGSARVADRSAPSCLPIDSKKKCLPTCRIVTRRPRMAGEHCEAAGRVHAWMACMNGYSAYRDD